MIGETLSLMKALFDAIGPGFLLALAIPFFLLGAAVFTRQAVRARQRTR